MRDKIALKYEGFFMMNNSQARLAINARIKSFTGIDQSKIQWTNQKDFKVPPTGLWCRVTIQYADTVESGLYRGLLQRDSGIINIQCFARKGTGDIKLIELADKWRDHFAEFTSSYLEVTVRHAPTDAQTELDTDFVNCLIRIVFRVN